MTPCPRLHSDIVEIFVVRPGELLQLRRAKEPMRATWQPVLGHIEEGETALEAALRELREETALADGAGLEDFTPLERVCPYYLPENNAIVLSPRFIARAAALWEPKLNDEHDQARWTPVSALPATLHWPSQREAWREAVERGLIP